MRNGMLSLLLVSLMTVGSTHTAVAQSANRAIIDEVSATTASIELFDLSPEEAAELQASGFRVTHDMCGGVIVTGEKRRVDSLLFAKAQLNRSTNELAHPYCPTFPNPPFSGFRTYAQVNARLDSLSTQYPNQCSNKFSIGTTIEGRNLWVVKVSDNPNTSEPTEIGIFYMSLIHAREPSGGAANLKFLEYLLQQYGTIQSITDLVNNSQIYFLIVANPDGYVYNESHTFNWRKNRNFSNGLQGIDLNRNFGFKWGYDNIGSDSLPAGDAYRGPSRFSEAEPGAVRDFVLDTNSNIKLCHSFHSFKESGMFLYPYGYAVVSSGRDQLYKNVGWQLHNGLGYQSVPIPSAAGTANGSETDWFWTDSAKASFFAIATEMRASRHVDCATTSQGWLPHPDSIATIAQELVAPNLFLAKLAANPNLWDFKQGDLTADNALDAADVTAFVDYLFVTFVEPVPLARADWNCDYQIDVTDLTACVNYVYSMGGTIPDCK